MKRSRMVVPGLGVAVLVAVAVWLSRRTDPVPADATRAPVVDYRLAWAFDPPARATPPVGFDPEHFGELVLVAMAQAGSDANRGAVYALDRLTGKLRWTFDAGGTLAPTSVAPSGFAPVFVADGPGGTGRLFALRDTDGTVRWDLTTAGRVTAPPGNGVELHQAAVPAGDDGVYLVDRRTGQGVWHFPAGWVAARPSLHGEQLIVATGASEKFPSSALVALVAETGAVAWQVPLPAPAAGGTPWVGEGIILVPLTHGLGCFDSRTGARNWVLPTPGPPTLEPRLLKFSGPGGSLLLAFVGRAEGLVQAIDVKRGRVEWSAAVGAPVVGPPRLAGEFVFAATQDGRLFQLNQRTGAGIGTFAAAELLGGNPTVLAAAPGPRAVLVAEVDSPDGRAVRVATLEHVAWFTRP